MSEKTISGKTIEAELRFTGVPEAAAERGGWVAHRRDHGGYEQRIVGRRLIASETHNDQKNQQQDKGEMQAYGNAHQSDRSYRARAGGSCRAAFLSQKETSENNCGTGLSERAQQCLDAI